ncbi:FadR/GntR family transcriptional regulator [Pseudonocardia halophobica]|uniref:FadR/GntR family transcriptional regulator n=1 Tax=Pseudonocardia halophobica TaxID=29401 RepID=UPI003D93A3B9
MKQSEIVARQISQQIVDDDLAEGTRLPPEKSMVEEYQVGRSTLREALRLLENRGVLSIKTGREGGPVVRRPHPSDLGEAISLALRFDGVTAEQVVAGQRALVPRLVRLAAENVSAAQLAAIGECLDRMDLYVEQIAVFETESRRFHTIVAEAAQSPVLAILVSAVDAVLDGFRADDPIPDTRQATRAARVKYTELHKRLHEALGRRDGDAAAAVALELIDMMTFPPQGRPGSRRGVTGGARARERRASERTA